MKIVDRSVSTIHATDFMSIRTHAGTSGVMEGFTVFIFRGGNEVADKVVDSVF